MVESALKAALREILYASMSLDDGLSTIQNLAIVNEKESGLYFSIARIIEEIILRRPGLASAMLTELSVRLAFDKDVALRKMLMLLDARYNNVHVRAECELVPDIEALPILLDIMSELVQGMTNAIELNLRPLLPFLTDEVLATLEGIYTRGHEASVKLAISDAHYLTTILSDAGVFDCSEAILNRLMIMARDDGYDEIAFDVSLDEASVLTEIGLYKESREILTELRSQDGVKNDPVKLAAITLQTAINDTRDDNIPHENARAIADEAANLFEEILDQDDGPKDGLGLAHLVIGSNILANGWREAVPEGIHRLETALKIFENIEDPTITQSLLLFKCMTGLGFAHGLMRDHANISKSLDYLDRAKTLLDNLDEIDDKKVYLARSFNALGWVCLSSESDEFWEYGVEYFEKTIKMREELRNEGKSTELELLGSKVGYGLSLLRESISNKAEALDYLHSTLTQFVPIFPTDRRAYIEIAIATYNIVWLSIRHSIDLTPRMLRLLDDIDRMLLDARSQEDSVFIQGVSLVVPYLTNSWNVLQKRSSGLLDDATPLGNIASLVHGLATAKRNLNAVNLESGVMITKEQYRDLDEIDPLLAQYWRGQNSLANTLRSYYENKDFSELATGLYRAAYELKCVETVEVLNEESAEFITSTALSLSNSLLSFSLALESEYAAEIVKDDFDELDFSEKGNQSSFLLADDWLGLLKISDSYLRLIKDSALVEAKPYLNAVFSNTARALRMMDDISMIERRVLSQLGDVMNKRYYLRT